MTPFSCNLCALYLSGPLRTWSFLLQRKQQMLSKNISKYAGLKKNIDHSKPAKKKQKNKNILCSIFSLIVLQLFWGKKSLPATQYSWSSSTAKWKSIKIAHLLNGGTKRSRASEIRQRDTSHHSPSFRFCQVVEADLDILPVVVALIFKELRLLVQVLDCCPQPSQLDLSLLPVAMLVSDILFIGNEKDLLNGSWNRNSRSFEEVENIWEDNYRQTQYKFVFHSWRCLPYFCWGWVTDISKWFPWRQRTYKVIKQMEMMAQSASPKEPV